MNTYVHGICCSSRKLLWDGCISPFIILHIQFQYRTWLFVLKSEDCEKSKHLACQLIGLPARVRSLGRMNNASCLVDLWACVKPGNHWYVHIVCYQASRQCKFIGIVPCEQDSIQRPGWNPFTFIVVSSIPSQSLACAPLRKSDTSARQQMWCTWQTCSSGWNRPSYSVAALLML